MLLLVFSLPKIGYDVVGKRIQLPACCDFGVQLTDRTGGNVPRISVNFFTFLNLFFINTLKIFFGQEYFSPYYEFFRDFKRINLFKPKWYSLNRHKILSNILSHGTITAGRPLYQKPTLINQLNSQAVNFKFQIKFSFYFAANIILQAGQPILNILP